MLLNASPDLRQQITENPALHPKIGLRHSPIVGAILSNGDIDHIAGLLSLRESQPLAIYAGNPVLEILQANRVFNVLDVQKVHRRELPFRRPISLRGPDDAPLGLEVEASPVPGKVPLYMESVTQRLGTSAGDTVGLRVTEIATGVSFYYVPGCSELSPALADWLRNAALVFFDGTLWRDDEMISSGTGAKTGQRMGHMSMSGGTGSIARLASLGIRRKIFIHINNTNPVLAEDSPERSAVQSAGWEIARDGMEINL
jgi:pyrroloquinoline quinone biosynthesis protein B